jgi:hypothetical protein
MVAFAIGCSAAGEPEPSVPRAGVVRGVVDYAGDLDGPLRIGVFASFPPRGRPMTSVEIGEPVFPQAYEIRGVPPGRWFVLAVVDRDPTDGDRYHPSIDPGGAVGRYEAPESVVVDADIGADGQDIVLVDPSANSPWAQGRYR